MLLTHKHTDKQTDRQTDRQADRQTDIHYAHTIIILYTYKFSRDVNFANDSNLGFSRFYFCGSLVITPCLSSVLPLFYEISRIKISWMTS